MSIQYEKNTIDKMIRLYCKSNHKVIKGLCNDCAELRNYAFSKLDQCPLKENKPVCKKCPIHCYSDERKNDIKNVMRFSGPRMIWYYPADFLKHILK